MVCKVQSRFLSTSAVRVLLIAMVCTSYSSGAEYFYRSDLPGSQRLYNPLHFIINGGYDIWQITSLPEERRLADFDYAGSWNSLWRTLTSPRKTIQEYGVRNFVFKEVIPDFSNFDPNHQQFFPNYMLHTIGGGMEYRKMTEWFAKRDYPAPRIFSGLTMAAQHILNEMVENGPRSGYSVDALADIYLFDPLGIVLFSNERVCRFFSRTLNMAEWPLSPVVDVTTGSLENSGQFFIFKIPLGQRRPWSLFLRAGLHEMAGISRTFTDSLCFTVAAGAGVEKVIAVDTDQPGITKTAQWMWSVAFFLDNRNSLLASLSISGLPQDRVRLNLYPGSFSSFRLGSFEPGFYTGYASDRFVAGLSFRWLPVGIAAGVD